MEHEYMIVGKVLFSWHIFGEFKSNKHLQSRDACLEDAAGYTMVKKNWFNGVKNCVHCDTQLDGHRNS